MLDVRSRCSRLFFSISFAVVTLLTFSSTLAAQTPTVSWNANAESDLSGYVVQYGTQAGSPSTSLDVGNVTSRQFTGLTAGATYYFRVVAYNSSGQQSSPSSEVSYAVPGVPTPSVTLTSISPTSGPTTGGTVLTLQGSNFVSGATVSVGGTAATSVTLISTTQLRATTPAGTAGARTVTVTNPSAQSASLANAFTYTAASSGAPTLTSVSPTSGPIQGGITITFTGTNFVSGATITIGGTPMTGVTFVSSTTLRATAPWGNAGQKTVVVTNPNGQSATLVNAYTYGTPTTPAPTLTSISPLTGPTTGGTVVTMNGSNFVSGMTATIGGTAMTAVTYVSATQIRATTPAGTAGAKTIVVTSGSQSATLANAFTYTAPATPGPTLTSVSPTSGPIQGGNTITMTGTNFVSGATITIGGTPMTGVTFVSATQLRATAPWGSAGQKTIVVTNPNGQTATLTNAYTYGTTSGSAPTLTSVSPTSGPIQGGIVITMTGANFVSGATITIGGTPMPGVTFVSATQLRATAPWGTAGQKTIVVTNPNGQTATLTNAYTYSSTSSLTSDPSTELAGASLESSASATSLESATSESLVSSELPSSAPLSFRRYLAEGAVTAEMSTRLAIANPEAVDANVALTFTDSNGKATRLALVVPARARRTVDLSEVPALAGASFSTLLESDQAVGLDRLIAWDRRGLAASLETAVEAPSTTWYFAEGSTTNPFELFYLVQNPGTEAAAVQVRYLLPDGLAPIVKRYTVAAGSRATIWVDREDPALSTTDVAAEITSVNGAPIVVERSLYVSEAGSVLPRGGDAGAGVTAPSSSWLLEGATGDYAMFLSLANPNAAPAVVTATFVREDGGRVVKSYTLAANSRLTVNVAQEDASLARAAMAVHVQTASETPVVAERTKWWGQNGAWDDSVSGGGVAEAGARWLLAEGEQGGARQASTSLVVFNTQATAADVTVTLLFEDGPEVAAVFSVAGNGQLAVPVAQAFPTAEGKRFSVLVEAMDPSAAIAVDRAIYWRAEGSTRTAGADAAATRLR
jgi:hypothetical protein